MLFISVLIYIYIYVFFVTGARVNAKDSKWLTPLHRAVASCSEVCLLISFELLCIKIEYLKVPSVLCSLFYKMKLLQMFRIAEHLQQFV